MADLLTVSHLKKYFSVKGGDEGETTLKAVDDISCLLYTSPSPRDA